MAKVKLKKRRLKKAKIKYDKYLEDLKVKAFDINRLSLMFIKLLDIEAGGLDRSRAGYIPYADARTCSWFLAKQASSFIDSAEE